MSKFAKRGSALSTRAEIEQMQIAIDKQSDSAKYADVDVDILEFNPNNDYRVLDTEASIRVLADDIYRDGLLHNIVVNKPNGENKYIIISGERRTKACRLLKHDPERNADGKWDKVHIKIYYGLTDRQCQILMDAGNLQSRGGVGDEKMLRKATNRYIKNLQEEYLISEEAALEYTTTISAYAPQTILRNHKIEERFIVPLKGMIDDGIIGKRECFGFFDFNKEEQEKAVSIITDAISAQRNGDDHRDADPSRIVKRILESADENEPGSEERRAALQDVHNELNRHISAIATKKEPDCTTLDLSSTKTATQVKDKYIDKLKSIKRNLAQFATKGKLDAISDFDINSGSGEKEFAAELNDIAEQAIAIRDALDKITAYNSIIVYGKTISGEPSTQNEINEATANKRKVLKELKETISRLKKF